MLKIIAEYNGDLGALSSHREHKITPFVITFEFVLKFKFILVIIVDVL